MFSKDYIIPPPFGGTYHWYGQLAANLSWNLDFWGKQAAIIARAKDSAEAAALDAAAARLALAGALAQTYINLLLAYQDIDIAQQTVAEREEILKLTQGRFNAGLENASAVEQAKALLALARVDVQRIAAAARYGCPCHRGADGAGRRRLCRPSPGPPPNLDTALPLPAASAGRSSGAPARHPGGAGADGGGRRRAARPRMPISIPTSI